MIEIICRKICGKSTFEEIKSCKHCERKNGIRICNNKKLCANSLVFEYEKLFEGIDEEQIVIEETIGNFNRFAYRCEKCKDDWYGCEKRKGEECTDKNQKQKMLIEKIEEVCPKYLVDIENYKYAEEIYEKYMDKIRKIRDTEKKAIKKVYILSKRDISKIEKNEIENFIKNKFEKYLGVTK